MGKSRKSKVRAQRKFAQGTLPAGQMPQQTTASAAPTVTVNANHRAVKSRGPVTKNMCSAKDLLTRMSLKSAHNHTIEWPIVVLQDCLKTLNIEPDKKKVGIKKRHSPRILRSIHNKVGCGANFTSSDSGEDLPLSHLQNSPVSKPLKNVPVGETDGTTLRTTSSDHASAQLAPKQGNVDPQRKRTRSKRTLPEPDQTRNKRVLYRRSNSSTPRSKSNLLPSSPEPDDQNDRRSFGPRTRSSTRNGPTSSTGSDITNSSKILSSTYQPPRKKKILKTKSALKNRIPNKRKQRQIRSQSSLRPLLTPLKAVQSKKTTTPALYGKQLAKDKVCQTVEKNQELADFWHRPFKQDTEYPGVVQSNDEDSNQADKTTMVQSIVVSNILRLNEDFKRDTYSLSNEDTASIQPEADTAEMSPDSLTVPSAPASSTNGMNLWNEKSIDKQESKDLYDLNGSFIKPDVDTCDAKSLHSFTALSEPVKLMNDWNSCSTAAIKVNSPSNYFDMATIKPIADTIVISSDSSVVQSVPARSTQNHNSCNTSEVITVNTPSNHLDMASITPQADIVDLTKSDSLIVPSAPAKCPLGAIDDLHSLLGSEVACKTCRRCSLVLLYDTISINLPKGRNDDPFFQMNKIPPNPANERSSTNQRREKVCNVLTRRRLPIWMINSHMKLYKDVFENEYHKGTLKLTLALNPEDDEDALVWDIIGRLEYLKNCIREDNMEVNLDTPLPSPKMPKNECLPCDDIEEVDEPILVYRPTPDEFKDPILYINGIRKGASKYGMCKIIPPQGSHIPYRLDENCVFSTTNQHLGRLFHRWGPNTKEFATIQTTMTSLRTDNKEQFIKAPLFSGMELDLVKFYHLILEEGGIQALFSHEEKWALVAKKMELVYPSSKLVWRKLETIYCKHVLPYESLTADERKAVTENVEKIWAIRSKNTSLRAAQPLLYHHAMLGLSTLEDYEEDYPPGEVSFLHNLCKPIYDKIEECIGKGRSMNLAKFREIAGTFQGMRFPKGLPSSIKAIEQNYWNILNLRKEHVCVLSAFIDTYVNSLGHESDQEKPGGSHPWNLKRIGENPDNVLHSLGKALCVTVPTLCVNQLFSTNCWHKDPHKLAWMDYMHEGATKIWYSVPNTGAPALRRAVQNMTLAAVQEKKIWLASDTTMIPPGHLRACGVPFHRIEQNPNEIIVVFPNSYASSISTGVSVSESIYFENNQWLDNVEQVIEEMCTDCEPAMFSSILLLMKMAKNPRLNADVLKQVNCILKKFITTEIEARREARRLNCRIITVTQGREECHLMPTAWPNQEECCVCRLPLVLSKMTQYDQPRNLMCIVHGTEHISDYKRRFRGQRVPEIPLVTLRYSEEELIEIMDTSVSS